MLLTCLFYKLNNNITGSARTKNNKNKYDFKKPLKNISNNKSYEKSINLLKNELKNAYDHVTNNIILKVDDEDDLLLKYINIQILISKFNSNNNVLFTIEPDNENFFEFIYNNGSLSLLILLDNTNYKNTMDYSERQDLIGDIANEYLIPGNLHYNEYFSFETRLKIYQNKQIYNYIAQTWLLVVKDVFECILKEKNVDYSKYQLNNLDFNTNYENLITRLKNKYNL